MGFHLRLQPSPGPHDWPSLSRIWGLRHPRCCQKSLQIVQRARNPAQYLPSRFSGSQVEQNWARNVPLSRTAACLQAFLTWPSSQWTCPGFQSPHLLPHTEASIIQKLVNYLAKGRSGEKSPGNIYGELAAASALTNWSRSTDFFCVPVCV